MEHIQPLEGSQAQGSELRAQHRAMGRDGLPCGAPSSANPVTSTEGFPGTNLKHILSTCPETKSAHPYGSRRMRLHLFIKYTISKRGEKKALWRRSEKCQATLPSLKPALSLWGSAVALAGV